MQSSAPSEKMRIDCIGSPQGYYPELCGGDVLIVNGSITRNESKGEREQFVEWINAQDYKKKILVGGSGDNFLVTDSKEFLGKIPTVEYLQDSGIVYEGLKIWGSPWTLLAHDAIATNQAFTVDTEDKLAKFWEKIPVGIDVLITHGAPAGVLEKTRRLRKNLGSPSLLEHVMTRIYPRLHVYSLMNENGGKTEDVIHTIFINCSLTNLRCAPINRPVRITL